jgi:glycosyltransferase involved in cell wall biosynthesis
LSAGARTVSRVQPSDPFQTAIYDDSRQRPRAELLRACSPRPAARLSMKPPSMDISVVTINLNKRAGLRRTLGSLRGQTDRDFELIVVDGGSTDGSLEEIARFDDVVDTSVSEKDKGIFDAWNKGIAQARGDIIALLNSGDAYHPDVVATVRRAVAEDARANEKIVCGTTIMVDDGRLVKKHPNALPSHLWFGIGIVHPAMFIGRRVYDSIGRYEPISIASDTDFVLRCIRRGVQFRAADYLVYMEEGGVSATQASKGFSQYAEALARHGFCRPVTATLLSRSYAVYRRLKRTFRPPRSGTRSGGAKT